MHTFELDSMPHSISKIDKHIIIKDTHTTATAICVLQIRSEQIEEENEIYTNNNTILSIVTNIQSFL